MDGDQNDVERQRKILGMYSLEKSQGEQNPKGRHRKGRGLETDLFFWKAE